MNNPPFEDTVRRLQDQAREYITDIAVIASQAQRQFLTSRSGTLQQIADLVRMQAGFKAPAQAHLFDRDMLEEFAAGSIERCLGEEYAVFREHRVPRIPNGALLLMDRILEISGTRGKLNQPSEIITEFDVPADAWFIQDSGSGTPYSILMEMALQPCGFMSAYLGTMLISPESNLYFRNLDGEARILRQVDLRGKTVRAWARMTGHTVNEETVIQKFEFQLETENQLFYEGSSVFGFFPEETMLRQLGLDNGKESVPEYLKAGSTNIQGKMIELLAGAAPDLVQSGLRLAVGRLDLLDQVYILPHGGSKGLGYIYASREIDPAAWFFQNHFYQDPVMPGSLGVEAILEAMRIFALDQGIGSALSRPSFSLDENFLQWKYRGQILKTTRSMFLEVDILSIEQDDRGIVIAGNASLWADGIRIYLVKNAAVRIKQG